MKKIIITLLSVLLSAQFIESKPRYGYRSWRKFVRSSEESSEESSESCIGCSKTNLGNGYRNHNELHYNSSPNQHQGQTDMYQEVEEQYESENQLVNTGGNGPAQNQGYNTFNGNGPQGSGGGGRGFGGGRGGGGGGRGGGGGGGGRGGGGGGRGGGFGGGGGGGRGGSGNNNQGPSRPNGRQVYINGGPYDYETNNGRKKSSEIGDFGNGHDNTNTFNIHKKNIYIS